MIHGTSHGVPWQAALADVLAHPVDADLAYQALADWAAGLGSKLIEVGQRVRNKGERLAGVEDPMVDFLEAKGLALDYGRGGEIFVECPWKHEHTSDSGVTESAWFPAGTNGYERGNYRCLHAHCDGRGAAEFEMAVGYYVEDFTDLTAEDVEQDLPQKQRRFEAIPFGEFINGPQPEWLIKGVMPRAGLGMIYGASGSGKSFFVLDMACAIARGAEWRGRKVNQTNVLYVCAEGAGGFRSRGQAYVQQHQVDLSASLFMIPAAPNFLTAMDPTEVIDEVRRVNAGFVVVDTLAQVTAGGDENSAAEMGKALAQCRRLHEETGAMVLLVHHAGKDAARGARGWSGLRAAVDVEIEVSGSTGVVAKKARITKMKDGPDGEEFGFKLLPVVVGFDADGDEIGSCIVEPTEIHQTARKPPKGHAAIVWRTYREMSTLDNGPVDAAALVKQAMLEFPQSPEGKRDPRKQNARRALAWLVNHGWLKEEDGMVRVTALQF